MVELSKAYVGEGWMGGGGVGREKKMKMGR